MRAKDRHLINRFLLWFPAAAVGVFAFYVTTAIAAAAIWPEAKSSVANQYAWALSLVSRSNILAAIAITLLWLIVFFYTRDTDDKSQKAKR